MILAGVVLAVLVALARGGKLERLSDLGIKGIVFVWIALLTRFGVDFLASRGYDWPWLQILAYILFIFVLRLNLMLPGIKVFAAGTLLNFLVITLNGGAMPVSLKAIKMAQLTDLPSGGTHVLLTESTRLWLLADIIPLRPPFFPMAQVISVGDILIVAGMFLFIQNKMLQKETVAAV